MEYKTKLHISSSETSIITHTYNFLKSILNLSSLNFLLVLTDAYNFPFTYALIFHLCVPDTMVIASPLIKTP
jgi:hypothetical protein